MAEAGDKGGKAGEVAGVSAETEAKAGVREGVRLAGAWWERRKEGQSGGAETRVHRGVQYLARRGLAGPGRDAAHQVIDGQVSPERPVITAWALAARHRDDALPPRHPVIQEGRHVTQPANKTSLPVSQVRTSQPVN